MSRQLDNYDHSILKILSVDGRIAVTRLARSVCLSKTPCRQRMQKLERGGYILGYRAVLNQSKLGREHVAFTEVKLSDTSEAALAAFNAAVRRIPEVEQCHMMASSYDYLLKVRTGNISDYRRVLGEEISKLPHISTTSSHVSMEAVVDQELRGHPSDKTQSI